MKYKISDYVQSKSQLFTREHGLELGQIVGREARDVVIVENCFTGRRHYIRHGRLVIVEPLEEE